MPFLTHAVVDDRSLDSFISQITKVDNTNDPYSLFQGMCKNMQNFNDTENNLVYDHRQSLFVTMFCNSLPDLAPKLGDKEVFYDTSEGIGQYLKRSTLRDLGFVCLPGQMTNDGCIAASRQSNNDYQYMMTKLMVEIQNERSNIALARLYGVSNIDGTDIDQINNIIARSYNAIANQTVKKEYPKTAKKMEEYIRAGNNLLKKLQIIDLKKIKNEESSLSSNGLCLLHAIFFTQIDQNVSTNCISSKEGNNRSYTHLLYNEIFFYTLFSSTYEQYLDQFQFGKKSSKPDEKIPGLSDLVTEDGLAIIRGNIATQRTSIIQTTNKTSKSLRDFESYFSLHIGMLMYQEDLIDFRGRLANIYLPLHQLHYKIENVQKAKTT